jgi:hypothetical protein
MLHALCAMQGATNAMNSAIGAERGIVLCGLDISQGIDLAE